MLWSCSVAQAIEMATECFAVIVAIAFVVIGLPSIQPKLEPMPKLAFTQVLAEYNQPCRRPEKTVRGIGLISEFVLDHHKPLQHLGLAHIMAAPD